MIENLYNTGVTRSNTFKIGDGTNGNKTIEATTAATNKPALRWNQSSGKWQFSNDGTTWSDVGTGSLPPFSFNLSPNSFSLPTNDPAEVTTELVGTPEVEEEVAWFDYAVEESLFRSFQLDDIINEDGNFVLKIRGHGKSSLSGKYIRFKFSIKAVAANEAGDGSYTEFYSDDLAVSSDPTIINSYTITKTLTELGIVGADLLFIWITRVDTAVEDNYADDWGLKNLKGDIDRG